jgi:hypothetical protein
MNNESIVQDDILPRRFLLCRDEDVSGLSGIGHVAEGVEFWDGTCAMRWRTAIRTTTFYASIQDLNAIHSHEGRTTIKWID